jgi:hypothetical protein
MSRDPGADMRFVIGQAFERIADKRQAVIADTRDDGRAGLLRFLDNGLAQWVLLRAIPHWRAVAAYRNERGRLLRRPLCFAGSRETTKAHASARATSDHFRSTPINGHRASATPLPKGAKLGSPDAQQEGRLRTQ